MSISQKDKTLIEAFLRTPDMVASVKRVLLGAVTPDEASASWLTDIDSKLDDAEYGRKVKVAVEARSIVERAFNDLKRLAGSNPQPGIENEAR